MCYWMVRIGFVSGLNESGEEKGGSWISCARNGADGNGNGYLQIFPSSIASEESLNIQSYSVHKFNTEPNVNEKFSEVTGSPYHSHAPR